MRVPLQYVEVTNKITMVQETKVVLTDDIGLIQALVTDVRDLLADEIEHGLDGVIEEGLQLYAALSAIGAAFPGGYDFTPSPTNADRTLELRQRFAAGGMIRFAPGKYKLKRRDALPLLTTANVPGGVQLDSPGQVIFEVEIDPINLEATVPTSIWTVYGSGLIDVGEGNFTWRYSAPIAVVGEVVSRTTQSVTVKPWPGEPSPAFNTVDTWFRCRNSPTYGIAPTGWNRDQDDERVPRPAPLVANGNGTFTLNARAVNGTVTGVTSYNPLMLAVTWDAVGPPSSRDLMVLKVPGQSTLDNRVIIAKGPPASDSDDDGGGTAPGFAILRPFDAATDKAINASALAGTWDGTGATVVAQPFDLAKVQVGDPFGLLARKRLGKPFVVNANAEVRGTWRFQNLMSFALIGKGNTRWNAGIIAEDPAQLWSVTSGAVWIKDNLHAPTFPVMRARGTGDNFYDVSATDLGKAYLSGAGTDVLTCAWTNPAASDTLPVKPPAGEVLYVAYPDGSRGPDLRVLGLDPANGSAAGGVKLSGSLPSDMAVGLYKIVNRTRSMGGRLPTTTDLARCVTTATPASGYGGYAIRRRIVGAYSTPRYARPLSSWMTQAISHIGGDTIDVDEIYNSGFKYRGGESAAFYFDRQGSGNTSSTVAEELEWVRRGSGTIIEVGYGGVSVSGMRVSFQTLWLERVGLLRATTAGIDSVAASDLRAGPVSELLIDRLLTPFPRNAWFEDPTGYLTVLSGSKLATIGDDGAMGTPKTGTDGQATILMPKRVKPEHVDRIRVWRDGYVIPSSKITADGSRTITLATGYELASTDTYIATHEWC